MRIIKSSRMAWGITLMLFGILLIFREYSVLPDLYLDFRNYPIYAGIIFLIFNKDRSIGLVLFIVGTLLRLSYEIHFVQNIATQIWAVLLFIVGLLIVVKVYRNEKNIN